MIHVRRDIFNESFHNSFRFIIRLANVFGLLPVSVVGPNEIVFKWKSWKCIYAAVLACIFVTHTIIFVINWAFVSFSFKQLVTQLSQINAFILLILYARLARKWPKCAKFWAEVDAKMSPAYGFPKTLNKLIVAVTVLFASAALGEYLIFVVYRVNKLSQGGDEFSVKELYSQIFPEYFSVIEFNGFSAFVLTITNFMGHLMWSFNDLFIVVISSALALRFKQITDRLRCDEKKINLNSYWIELRTDYERLVRLSVKIDKYISYIVLLSYSANVFFLLILLANVIGQFNLMSQIIYYLFTFAFLITRLILVSLYGAWISEESKQPAFYLHGISATTYNLEIRRFLFHVSFNDVGITGNKMFKVTRGLLLNVAGAVVTYELVILQFNVSEQLK